MRRVDINRAKIAVYLAYKLRMSKAAIECNRVNAISRILNNDQRWAWNRAYREYDLAYRLLYRCRLQAKPQSSP